MRAFLLGGATALVVLASSIPSAPMVAKAASQSAPAPAPTHRYKGPVRIPAPPAPTRPSGGAHVRTAAPLTAIASLAWADATSIDSAVSQFPSAISCPSV